MDIIDRTVQQYEKVVTEFLDFVFGQGDENEIARCPCKKCNNNKFWPWQLMYDI